MPTIDDYLDAAKSRLEINSDRQLSQRLGASSALTNMWRTRRYWPSEMIMRKLAAFAGMDEELALLDLEIWRQKDADTANVFRRIRDRIVKLKDAAACIMIASSIAAQTPHLVQNNTSTDSLATTQMLYIMERNRIINYR